MNESSIPYAEILNEKKEHEKSKLKIYFSQAWLVNALVHSSTYFSRQM